MDPQRQNKENAELNIPPVFSIQKLLDLPTNEIDAYIKLHADALKEGRKLIQPQIYSIVYKKFSSEKSEEALQLLNSYFALFYPNRKPFPLPVKPKVTDVEVLVDNRKTINVNKALDVDSQKLVVQKYLAKFRYNGHSIDDHDLLLEAFTYAQFGNKERYFLNFDGFVFGGGIPMIQLDYAVSNLREYIAQHIKLPLRTQLSFMLDLVRGLMVLHDQYNIIHCDIRPANLYIGMNVDGSEYIKIADFELPIFRDATLPLDPNDPIEITTTYTSAEGLHRNTPITFAHDVHCVGRTAMVMERNTSNYTGINNNKIAVLNYLISNRNNPQKLDPKYNPSDVGYKNLVLNMIAYEPVDRPSLKQIEQTLVQFQNKHSAGAI